MLEATLYPAYWFTCRRCKNLIFIPADVMSFGGDKREYISELCKIDIDAKIGGNFNRINNTIASLRMDYQVYPIGHNLEVIHNRESECPKCSVVYENSEILESSQSQDAVRWSCRDCEKDNFDKLIREQEHSSKLYKSHKSIFIKKINKGDLPSAMVSVVEVPRMVICHNSIVIIDRVSRFPRPINCKYCFKKHRPIPQYLEIIKEHNGTYL